MNTFRELTVLLSVLSMPLICQAAEIYTFSIGTAPGICRKVDQGLLCERTKDFTLNEVTIDLESPKGWGTALVAEGFESSHKFYVSVSAIKSRKTGKYFVHLTVNDHETGLPRGEVSSELDHIEDLNVLRLASGLTPIETDASQGYRAFATLSLKK